MKVYLVSEIIASPDERMQKSFELFKSKEDAIEYLQWKKEEFVNDIAEHYDYGESEDRDIEDYLMDWVDIVIDEDYHWVIIDDVEEIELEVTELNISSIN
jgi:hypothetical protein